MSSDYVMMPGARLEIGPGGRPYETLGATLAEYSVMVTPPPKPPPRRSVRRIRGDIRHYGALSGPCCAPCGAGQSLCRALGDTPTPTTAILLAAAAALGFILFYPRRRR